MLAQPASADSTERVSVDGAGVQANGGSRDASISADGRFVAFESAATLLVVGDTNGATDVFVHDRLTGTTERVSINSAEIQGDGISANPSISADGRFVTFTSAATNLVAGDTNGADDVFVRDRQTETTERASVDSAAIQGNADSLNPSISADGRFVAFFSAATNLVANDTNGWSDVFVHDRATGNTERVSVTSGEGQVVGGNSQDPAISEGGRFVAFTSFATNVVAGDTNGGGDVFVRDRVAGTTQRVSVSSLGAQGNSGSRTASISTDGRFVAFHSAATNLVANDTNGVNDVFVRDRQAGTTERLSVSSFGAQGNGDSEDAAISADGRFVAFDSDAGNLIFPDLNADRDVFVRDRRTGTTRRVSIGVAGNQANDNSDVPSISANGGFVAFSSSATNLVANDTNGEFDVFLRDRGVLPDGRNDVLVDFGGAGLWQRLNDTTWQKIHNASPAMVAAGDLDGSLNDEAIASFGGAGVWARYNNATWMKVHPATTQDLVAGGFD